MPNLVNKLIKESKKKCDFIGNNKENVLHIYGQNSPHDDVAIVGDKKALENLKNIIDRALNGEMVVLDDDADCFFTKDGEGFNVKIWCESNTKELTLPYKG